MNQDDQTLVNTLKTISLEAIKILTDDVRSNEEFETELFDAASRRLIFEKIQIEECRVAIESDATFLVLTMRLSPYLLNYEYDASTGLALLSWDLLINLEREQVNFAKMDSTDKLYDSSFIEVIDYYEDMQEVSDQAHNELMSLINTVDDDLPNSL